MISSSNGGRRSSTMPSIPSPRTERKIFPMLSRCKIARTPGIFSAALVSSLVTLPLAIVASTGTAYKIPGKWKSEAYFATPLTFSGPSTRGVLRPIGDAVAVSCVVAMFLDSLGGLSHQLQCVHQAAFGQLDLKTIMALLLGTAQRRLSRFPEDRLGSRL